MICRRRSPQKRKEREHSTRDRVGGYKERKEYASVVYKNPY